MQCVWIPSEEQEKLDQILSDWFDWFAVEKVRYLGFLLLQPSFASYHFQNQELSRISSIIKIQREILFQTKICLSLLGFWWKEAIRDSNVWRQQ